MKETREKIILGFVGDLAAGKSTVAAYLHNSYGANSHRFSTMLRDMLDRIYVAHTREHLQALSTFVRYQYGEDIMSRVIARDVGHDPQDLVVVEGIRRPSDVRYLKDLTGFYLVYLTAAPDIRWQRLRTRRENPDDAEKTFAQFLTDEQAEADSLILDIAKEAGFTIVNNGSIPELHAKIEAVLEALHQTHEN